MVNRMQMNKKAVVVLAVVVAVTAVVVPIIAAIDQARRQGLEAEQEHMLSYAHDVLGRSEGTAEQFDAGIRKLREARETDPCSERSLALMRDIDLSSSYLQAIGYVSQGRLVCSSLGKHGRGIDLGPADLVTSRGVAIRNNLKLPFAPDATFVALELNGYVVIVHKDQPIDIKTHERDVSLALFSLAGKGTGLSARGPVDPKWINRLGKRREVVFRDDGYVVAVVGSEKYAIGALAALPVSYLDRRIRDVAAVLIPLGLVAGLTLAYAVFWLTQRRAAMPTVLKAALKRNQFFLDYQPVVDLRTGRCVGAEALIRWRQPNGSVVRPDLFIPVAEQTGLIARITARMMRLVAGGAGQIFRAHPDFHIAINLSADDIQSDHVIEALAALIRDAGCGPANIIVEVTERGFLQADIARGMLSKIRATGVQIAIDDFGTGYSSLSYLGTFELDYLKIDKSFVDTIGTGAATSHVVKHIIEMAKALDLKMIAEGIETEAQAQYLREHGVQYAQGWLFGKPMPLHEIAKRLAHGA